MRRTKHDRRVLALALGASLPGVVLALVLVWSGDLSLKVQLTLTVALLVLWLGFTIALKERVVRPLQVLANLLGAIREGDYSLRARELAQDDSLGLAFEEVNTLGDTLKGQRFREIEASTLLDKVLAEIQSAIFVFDEELRLRLVNRAGTELLGLPRERALHRTAKELGLTVCLGGPETRVVEASFPGGSGRWDVRRSGFRGDGEPQELVVLTSLERALRAEERQAWQRLIRVVSHEINNSLAPIQSIAMTLREMLRRPLPEDWKEDFEQGLEVIGRRSQGLNRFMTSYAKLARLPAPSPSDFAVRSWLTGIVDLETRLSVAVDEGPDLTIHADRDQLDQVLINLLRNAVDAALETDGGVRLGWSNGSRRLEIWIEDEGPGLSETKNLFVPFFTTKKDGSGIGLALSRQIVEGHGGRLELSNRMDRTGCRAVLTLPLA